MDSGAEDPQSPQIPRTRSRTIVRVRPDPEKARPLIAPMAGQVEGGYPDHTPIPNPEVNPDTRTRTILLEIPMVLAPSPRAV